MLEPPSTRAVRGSGRYNECAVDPVTGLVSISGSAGALYVADRVRRKIRVQGHVARRLREAELEMPLETGHLTPSLAGLVAQSRIVRLALETPLRRCSATVSADTPWRRRERCDEFDRALVDARMAIWDWIRTVWALDPRDRSILLGLGLSPMAMQKILFTPGVFERTGDVWEQVLYPVEPDLERVSDVLGRAMMDLRRFEVALLSWRPDPYR